MSSSAVLTRCALLLAVAATCGCSVTRRQVDLLVQGDVPATDTRGRRLAPPARAAVGETLARQVTVGFTCREDEACDPAVSVVPITRKLGRPPTPARIAAEMAPRGAASETERQDVRHAYDEAVRTRYRLYAEYLFGQMAGADWVEVRPLHGNATTRRYSGSRVDDGLQESLRELADHYAALEWARFERTWGTGKTRAVPATAPTPAAAPPPAPATPPTPAATSAPQHERGSPSTREIIIEADPFPHTPPARTSD